MARRRGTVDALVAPPPLVVDPNEFLAQEEITLFERLFPGESMANLSARQVRDRLLAAEANVADNMQGIQDLTPDQLSGRGIVGQNFDGPSARDLHQDDFAQNHAQTYVPVPFRMRHHRAGSGLHQALLGRVVVLTFHEKKSCAGFCRFWNMMMSHIGCADPFIPADLIQAFGNIVVAGSADIGLANEFSPPFPGRINI
jgi:hypothetical protein